MPRTTWSSWGNDDVAVVGLATPVEHAIEPVDVDRDHHALGWLHLNVEAGQFPEAAGPRARRVHYVLGVDPFLVTAARARSADRCVLDRRAGHPIAVGVNIGDADVRTDRRAARTGAGGGRGDE